MKERVWSPRRAVAVGVLLAAGGRPPLGAALGASDLDEFKVKREQAFEFAQKRQVPPPRRRNSRSNRL